MPDRRLTEEKREQIVHFITTTNLKNKPIADELGVSERTIYLYRKRLRTTGRAVHPRKGRAPGSGNYKLYPMHEEAILELSEYKNDLHLEILRDFLTDKHGLDISVSTLSRYIQRTSWNDKKAARIASKRNETLRAAYKEKTKAFTPDMFVFVDETGVDPETGARLLTSWASKENGAMRRSFFGKGSCVILPALTVNGLLDFIVNPTTKLSPKDFMLWMRHLVIPKMQRFPAPNSILVVELSPPPGLRALCEEAGVKLVCLPPKSSDLNPIELFFSDLDRHLRKQEYDAAEIEGIDANGWALLLRRGMEQLASQKDVFASYFKKVGLTQETATPVRERAQKERERERENEVLVPPPFTQASFFV